MTTPALYFHTDDQVRDTLRERSGGIITAIHGRELPHVWIDVRWPDGTESRYGSEAARDALEVEQAFLFDIFRLGVEFT